MVARKKSEKRLTDVELELMNIIWDRGECTVKDVQLALPEDRDLAYTSVATILKILEQKEILKSTKRERAHTYTARLSRQEYEAMSLRHLTAHVFQDDPTALVLKLLNEAELSKQELQAIRKVLEKRILS